MCIGIIKDMSLSNTAQTIHLSICTHYISQSFPNDSVLIAIHNAHTMIFHIFIGSDQEENEKDKPF